MEETSVKQLLKTTNNVLIMIMLLFALNLAADVLGLKSQDLVIKNFRTGEPTQIEPFQHMDGTPKFRY
tara:strand:+ start:328 stop:531 length:204 start_codon:yes stop_codon:yes gene_type:complete